MLKARLSLALLLSEQALHLRQEPSVLDGRREQRLPELVGERDHVGIPIARLLGQPAHDDRLDLGPEYEIGASAIQRDRWLGQQLREHLARCLREVRQAAGEQEIGDGGQAVLIRGGSNDLSAECLWCDVHQRADKESSPGQPLICGSLDVRGYSEVQQLYLSELRIIHDVFRLKVTVNDPCCMCGMNSSTNLSDDDSCFFSGERRVLLGVLLKELSSRPFDGQEVKPGIRLANFYGTYHVRVLYSCAVLRFADKTSHCGAIMSQFFAKNLEGNGSMARMLSPVNLGSTALANLTLYGVPGYL